MRKILFFYKIKNKRTKADTSLSKTYCNQQELFLSTMDFGLMDAFLNNEEIKWNQILKI